MKVVDVIVICRRRTSRLLDYRRHVVTGDKHGLKKLIAMQLTVQQTIFEEIKPWVKVDRLKKI